jgi:hypothetical protein
MKGISKLIIILILLVSTTVIILMSMGSFGISNKAMEKSEAVDLSKSIAEMFASVDTDDDFIELLDSEWELELGDDIIVNVDGKTAFVNIVEEKTDEGNVRYANIEVFIGGESTYILNTSKYVSDEKEQL